MPAETEEHDEPGGEECDVDQSGSVLGEEEVALAHRLGQRTGALSSIRLIRVTTVGAVRSLVC